MLAALTVGGGFLVEDPVAGCMTGGIGVVALIAVAAASTGGGGVTHSGAGGGGHFGCIIMTQGVLQNGSADHAELGLGAGSGLAGSVTLGRQCLQTVIVTADAAILHQTLAAAGGRGHFAAFIPRMAKSLGVVGNVAVLAAGAGNASGPFDPLCLPNDGTLPVLVLWSDPETFSFELSKT